MWSYYQTLTPAQQRAKARKANALKLAALFPGIGSSRPLIVPNGGDISFPLSGLRTFLRTYTNGGGTSESTATTPTTTTTAAKPEPIAAEQPVKTFTQPTIAVNGQLYTTQSLQPVSFAPPSNVYVPPQRVEGEVAPDPLSAEYAALSATGAPGYGVPTVGASPPVAKDEGLSPLTWVMIAGGVVALLAMRKRKR